MNDHVKNFRHAGPARGFATMVPVYRVCLFRNGTLEPAGFGTEQLNEAEALQKTLGQGFPDSEYYIVEALAWLN